MACVQSDEKWKRILTDTRVRLEECLCFDDIKDILIQERLLSIDKTQEIDKAETSRKCQAERLIDLLNRKRKDHYENFRRSLKEIGGVDFILDELKSKCLNTDLYM